MYNHIKKYHISSIVKQSYLIRMLIRNEWLSDLQTLYFFGITVSGLIDYCVDEENDTDSD